MLEFQVTNMTCGHCASVITKALHSVDPAAQVEIDFAGKRVRVRTSATTQALETALRDAGYTPVRVGATP